MKILKIAFLLILLITVSELIYYVFITNPTLLDTINPLAAKNKTIIPKNNQISNSGGNQVMLGDIKQYFLNKDIKNGQSFYLVEQLTGKLGEKTALSDDGRFQIMEIVNAQNKAIDGTEISKEDILKRVYRLGRIFFIHKARSDRIDKIAETESVIARLSNQLRSRKQDKSQQFKTLLQLVNKKIFFELYFKKVSADLGQLLV